MKRINLYILLLFQLILLIISIYNFTSKKIIKKNFAFFLKNEKNIYNKKLIYLDYIKNSFVIIKRTECPFCGLFSFYNVYLGCVIKYISLGYIPIFDLLSFPNIYNKMKVRLSSKNPWEIFFYQPFGYNLKDVIHKAKNVIFTECQPNIMPDSNIFSNNILMDFWSKIAKFYVPIKNEILIEANNYIKKIFDNSKNILGILVRGTDYITIKPKDHPIPPTPEMVINDIKILNKKNNYDSFFISTEDDNIRKIFIKEFKNKLKYLIYIKNINYNYNNKNFIGYNKNILGNLEYIKIYLLNIIILSKCIDLISANTSGAIGVFILTNGFRYSKIYKLGNY